MSEPTTATLPTGQAPRHPVRQPPISAPPSRSNGTPTKGLYPTELNAGVLHHVVRLRVAANSNAANRPRPGVAENCTPPQSIPYRTAKQALTYLHKTSNEVHYQKFQFAGLEPSFFQGLRTAFEKTNIYSYEVGDPYYPPHVAAVPESAVVPLDVILNPQALKETKDIIFDFWNHSKIPDPIYEVKTIDDIIENDRAFHAKKPNPADPSVYDLPNIGERDDWYSDEVFAQQMFTGVNPMIIKGCWLTDWLPKFQGDAQTQSRDDVVNLLSNSDPKSFFVADYSYFRAAMGLGPTANIQSSESWFKVKRYGAAPVALLQMGLEGDNIGVLHPLAIILDYKGSMDASVTIFNSAIAPGGTTLAQQKEDWPWRYAKTVWNMADWLHHEARVHLTETHLIEESIIVGSHLTLDDDAPLLTLLERHWIRTLSLNSSARSILVPDVIIPIAPVPADAAYTYIKNMFATFDFVGMYVPNDLTARGIDITLLADGKGIYRNFTYARNMILMWNKLREFVSNYLDAFPDEYGSDALVAANTDIRNWCSTIRDPAQGGIALFPDIQTRDELVDALTMCIHIASPQHTAINYPQQYYMSLVINKPPALYTPLPTSLPDLKSMTEEKLMSALPIGYGHSVLSPEYFNQTDSYMKASHLPWLLSYEVAVENSLWSYASSLMGMSTGKVHDAAVKLYNDLDTLQQQFILNEADITDKQTQYGYLNPVETAVSILI